MKIKQAGDGVHTFQTIKRRTSIYYKSSLIGRGIEVGRKRLNTRFARVSLLPNRRSSSSSSRSITLKAVSERILGVPINNELSGRSLKVVGEKSSSYDRVRDLLKKRCGPRVRHRRRVPRQALRVPERRVHVSRDSTNSACSKHESYPVQPNQYATRLESRNLDVSRLDDSEMLQWDVEQPVFNFIKNNLDKFKDFISSESCSHDEEWTSKLRKLIYVIEQSSEFEGYNRSWITTDSSESLTQEVSELCWPNGTNYFFPQKDSHTNSVNVIQRECPKDCESCICTLSTLDTDSNFSGSFSEKTSIAGSEYGDFGSLIEDSDDKYIYSKLNRNNEKKLPGMGEDKNHRSVNFSMREAKRRVKKSDEHISKSLKNADIRIKKRLRKCLKHYQKKKRKFLSGDNDLKNCTSLLYLASNEVFDLIRNKKHNIMRKRFKKTENGFSRGIEDKKLSEDGTYTFFNDNTTIFLLHKSESNKKAWSTPCLSEESTSKGDKVERIESFKSSFTKVAPGKRNSGQSHKRTVSNDSVSSDVRLFDEKAWSETSERCPATPANSSITCLSEKTDSRLDVVNTTDLLQKYIEPVYNTKLFKLVPKPDHLSSNLPPELPTKTKFVHCDKKGNPDSIVAIPQLKIYTLPHSEEECKTVETKSLERGEEKVDEGMESFYQGISAKQIREEISREIDCTSQWSRLSSEEFYKRYSPEGLGYVIKENRSSESGNSLSAQGQRSEKSNKGTSVFEKCLEFLFFNIKRAYAKNMTSDKTETRKTNGCSFENTNSEAGWSEEWSEYHSITESTESSRTSLNEPTTYIKGKRSFETITEKDSSESLDGQSNNEKETVLRVEIIEQVFEPNAPGYHSFHRKDFRRSSEGMKPMLIGTVEPRNIYEPKNQGQTGVQKYEMDSHHPTQRIEWKRDSSPKGRFGVEEGSDTSCSGRPNSASSMFVNKSKVDSWPANPKRHIYSKNEDEIRNLEDVVMTLRARTENCERRKSEVVPFRKCKRRNKCTNQERKSCLKDHRRCSLF